MGFFDKQPIVTKDEDGVIIFDDDAYCNCDVHEEYNSVAEIIYSFADLKFNIFEYDIKGKKNIRTFNINMDIIKDCFEDQAYGYLIEMVNNGEIEEEFKFKIIND